MANGREGEKQNEKEDGAEKTQLVCVWWWIGIIEKEDKVYDGDEKE